MMFDSGLPVHHLANRLNELIFKQKMSQLLGVM